METISFQCAGSVPPFEANGSRSLSRSVSMMISSGNQATHGTPHWLHRYATGYHQWRSFKRDGSLFYYRPLGIVESFFDTDGTDFEGRADLNAHLILDSRCLLSKDALRQRICLAWAVLRTQHSLLSGRALAGSDFLPGSDQGNRERHFVIEELNDPQKAVQNASDTLVFLEDHYPHIDVEDFYQHVMNTTRAIDSKKALAKLFILPLQPLSHGRHRFQTILIAAHQITDGLTIYRWNSHLIDLLNLDTVNLEHQLSSLCSSSVSRRLPAAQEDLYPPVRGNLARQRWYWAISRILRHTRRPPPPSFPNPLRRAVMPAQAAPMPPTYSKVLSYSKVPPLNSFTQEASLSPRATNSLRLLCRAAGASIGSGCFALVGLVMMILEERLHPSIALSQRRPFVGSFPVNPRPFLAGPSTTGAEDSLMLAFSDGLTLPFLCSDLPVNGRFKLLARQADRQLRTFQKKKRSREEEIHMGSRSPSQLIPSLYIGSVERAENKVTPERRQGINPQGAYPAKQSETLSTCGVSSVGSRVSLIGSGKYDLEQPEKDFVADFRDFKSTVRVRDGEFLVGSAGDKDQLHFSVSFDGNAIDPAKVAVWKSLIEEVLEPATNQRSRL